MSSPYISKEASNIAKQGISKCIDRYIDYVLNLNISKSSATKYKGILRIVIGDFNIPISQITDKQVNEYLSELYFSKKWSDKYTATVLSVLSKFFIWCKNNNYTLLSFKLINPIDGSKPVVKSEVTPKQDFNSVKTKAPAPMSNILEGPAKNNNTTITNSPCIYRDMALIYVYKNTTITPEEMCNLSIYDFLHTKLVVQSLSNRNFMRIIPIDVKTRNMLYEYLSTRKDNNEALFLSELQVGERITEAEIKSVVLSRE